MKGQGVAQNYRYPLHRHCGDIDLYIGPDNYEKANALLRKEVTSELEETYKHINVVWHGVTVENHRVLTQLSAPLADRRLQAEIKRWHGSDECRKRWIDDVEVTLAPLPFDTAFVLIHSVQHFLNEGIGLRQICDWACMLHAQRNLPGKEDIAHLLKSFGLEKAARVFGALAVCFLGLPQEDLPIAYRKKDIPTAEWLLNDIWQGGNFGHYDQERQNRPKGYWKGKWISTLIMRITDIFLSIPPVILALCICAVLRPTMFNSLLAVSITWWTWYCRLVYGMATSLKNEMYIKSAELIGASKFHILFREILPNCMGSILTKMTLDMGWIILTGATLGFVGMGEQPPTPSLGTMVADGAKYIPGQWWISIFPAIAIMIIVLGFNLLGDGVKDMLSNEG